MASNTLSGLGRTYQNGYSTSDVMLLLDITDSTMAPAGTDKGITVATFLTQYVSTGLTITQWTCGVAAATVTGNACTCDASVSEKWTVALGSGVATTITLANIAVGQTLEVTTFQPGSGSAGTVTWAGQTIRWSGGTVGQVTATLSKGDMFVFACRSSGIISGAVAVPNF